MRVRWSQLVYRAPGSDNEVALARVYRSQQGEVMRFREGEWELGEVEMGYLALVPMAQTWEDELDEWVEVEPDVFLERERRLWSESSASSEQRGLWFFLRMLWWRWSAWTHS